MRNKSNERLNFMHQILDNELNTITNNKHRPSLKNCDEFNDKQYLADLQNYQPTNKSKKNQINDLEKKLMELERKMDDIDVSSNDSMELRIQKQLKIKKEKLPLKQEIKITKPNQDTARFLLSYEEKDKIKEKQKEKLKIRQKNIKVFTSSEEEDSDDYYQFQKEIEKNRKNQDKTKSNLSKIQNLNSFNKNPFTVQQVQFKENNQRKASVQQIQSVLQPKYQNIKKEKERASVKKSNHSMRDSVTSKKTIQKNQPEKKLVRVDSKRSLKSINSRKSQSKKKRFSVESQKQFDKYSQKSRENYHNEETDLTKEVKKITNLQKQLLHYKRLTRKLQEKVDDFRVMEIQFKTLKANFAKSEQIRLQQKKVIETLKSKLK